MLAQEIPGTVLPVCIGTCQMYAFLLGASVIVLEFDLKEVVLSVHIGSDAYLLAGKTSVVVVKVHDVVPVVQIEGAVLGHAEAVD